MSLRKIPPTPMPKERVLEHFERWEVHIVGFGSLRKHDVIEEMMGYLGSVRMCILASMDKQSILIFLF